MSGSSQVSYNKGKPTSNSGCGLSLEPYLQTSFHDGAITFDDCLSLSFILEWGAVTAADADPFYLREKYILVCIQSVKGWTFRSDHTW